MSGLKGEKALVCVLLVVFILSFFAGCSLPGKKAESDPDSAISGTERDGTENGKTNDNIEAVTLIDFKNVLTERVPEFTTSVQYALTEFKPAVRPYEVNDDLSNISNLEQFGAFSEAQKGLLAKNGFFVSPTQEQQLFFIYEQNDYKNIPSFITTDSVMHLYHIFYDFTLRKVERDMLMEPLKNLTAGMLKTSSDVYKALKDEKVKDAALKNTAYFLVATELLEIELTNGVPEEAAELAQAELELIEKAAGRQSSAIFPTQLDYSQFIVRGHYTRSEDFKKYFKAMMWYGQVPFPFETKVNNKIIRMDESIIEAMLMTAALVTRGDYIENWEKIYSPTAFYVGSADDITPYQYANLMKKVLGDSFDLNDFSKEEVLQGILEESRNLPEPKIKQDLYGIAGERAGEKQFRFMGQRYIPDSEMLQELTKFDEKQPEFGRPFPKSLDVMSVLGSDRAYDLLINVFKEHEKWEEYPAKMDALRQKFDALPETEWQSNLYYGWLWALKSLFADGGNGYPDFMNNQAWQDKDLNSASGSWAELRHDTILYGKQSGAECGGGDEPPEPPKGYVEPRVEYYSRLLWLTAFSRENLSARGLIDDELSHKFREMEELLEFLRDVSVKELQNQKLTREEYDQIKIYGARLESLSASIATDGETYRWFEITSETDRNMALIADVHTSLGYCLETGVGPAHEIFVVVPVEGELVLTRGAVFSYYEFVHPISDRLTDEKWQEMLKSGQAPPQPSWTNSFTTEQKEEIPIPKEYYHSGC